ncbi:3-methyl-2-oxobutanoate hydroxymethyltransferase [Aliikangiella maris]|uniref:3-methyl-2-oxobutanoate hydroxymethyltransferase n=2 Tax=Aliikangiella maris TaxID=3162458 RepID=A0ABV3MM36_9GAMM
MKKQTIGSLLKLKQRNEPITVLTAYDATFAKLVSQQGVEVILVGDSLGMVMQGHTTTVPVNIEEMVYHTQCVSRGNQGALIVSDFSFMSYATPEQTYTNAQRLMQAGANMVKLEGGEWLLDTIRGLTERGIPVCAHLGLTPQSVDILGGYKIQGRDEETAEKIYQDAIALQAAGAKLLVLECIPQLLSEKISKALTIPTIGIGAGKQTDGQVLVLQDMLGMDTSFSPAFVRNFMLDPSVNSIADAIKCYVNEVKQGNFPASEHCFD